LAEDDTVLARRQVWLGIPARLVVPIDALDAAAEVIAHAKSAVKEREKAQKTEVAELADAMGEGRGTAGARNALAKRHKRELRRVEEEVLAEALTSVASYYRDVLAIRSGADEAVTNIDRLGDLAAWAEVPVADGALLAAAERCIATRASFQHNANVPLAMEAAFVELARLVPPPSLVPTGR
jgi:DNA polymerase-3 subunit delta'